MTLGVETPVTRVTDVTPVTERESGGGEVPSRALRALLAYPPREPFGGRAPAAAVGDYRLVFFLQGVPNNATPKEKLLLTAAP